MDTFKYLSCSPKSEACTSSSPVPELMLTGIEEKLNSAVQTRGTIKKWPGQNDFNSNKVCQIGVGQSGSGRPEESELLPQGTSGHWFYCGSTAIIMASSVGNPCMYLQQGIQTLHYKGTPPYQFLLNVKMRAIPFRNTEANTSQTYISSCPFQHHGYHFKT